MLHAGQRALGRRGQVAIADDAGCDPRGEGQVARKRSVPQPVDIAGRLTNGMNMAAIRTLFVISNVIRAIVALPCFGDTLVMRVTMESPLWLEHSALAECQQRPFSLAGRGAASPGSARNCSAQAMPCRPGTGPLAQHVSECDPVQ